MTGRAGSVQVSTLAEGASIVIPVLFQHTDQRADRRLQRYLAPALASPLWDSYFGGWLVAGGCFETRGRELQDQRFTQHHAEFGQQTGTALEQAIQSLQARKRAAPSAGAGHRRVV